MLLPPQNFKNYMKTESIILKQILSLSSLSPASNNWLYKCWSWISLSWDVSLAFFSFEKLNLSSLMIVFSEGDLWIGDRDVDDFLKNRLVFTVNLVENIGGLGEVSELFPMLQLAACKGGILVWFVLKGTCLCSAKRDNFLSGIRVLLENGGILRRSIIIWENA